MIMDGDFDDALAEVPHSFPPPPSEEMFNLPFVKPCPYRVDTASRSASPTDPAVFSRASEKQDGLGNSSITSTDAESRNGSKA